MSSAAPRYDKREGHVATSIADWAQRVELAGNILATDPNRNTKIWNYNLTGQQLRSGSEISESEYLRLRVLWFSWDGNQDFKYHMRDHDNLRVRQGEDTVKYTGYVSLDNDDLAFAIYEAIKGRWASYMEDIKSKFKADGTRPGPECGEYMMARYYQAMVKTRIKKKYSIAEMDRACQVQVTSQPANLSANMASLSLTSQQPSTPIKGKTTSQASYGTPRVVSLPPAAGGKQNPPTTDETYVNTAALLLLQALQMGMAAWDAENAQRPGARSIGLTQFDWLADRLALRMGMDSGLSGQPLNIMEARVDGYLCRRGYAGNDIVFNNWPLAILEAKPFLRRNAITQIRKQESAEMACWVSGLDDDHEQYGLLQSSTSGRKRRLLIAQDRDEIWIVIAEYGEKWKQYVKGHDVDPPKNQPQDAIDLAGSDAFVANALATTPDVFKDMIKRASNPTEHRAGGAMNTRSSSRSIVPLELPGPEYFCFMNQWGPFNTDNGGDMDLFLRRMIALQVQLLDNGSKNLKLEANLEKARTA